MPESGPASSTLDSADSPSLIPPTSTVEFHPLRRRRSESEWFIGRVDLGEFVAIPDEGMAVIDHLDSGMTITETNQTLAGTHTGDDADEDGIANIIEFVEGLSELGFVRTINGDPVNSPAAPRPFLRFLAPRHVRWLLHPATAVVVLAIILSGVIPVLWRPEQLPSWRDLLWSNVGTWMIIGNVAIGWLLVLIHELGHVATARAVGAPGRLSFGTRLQFLVVQTDVSGVWGEPRRTRLTVYLAGIAINLLIVSGAAWLKLLLPPNTVGYHLAAAILVLSLIMAVQQGMIFMRTDLYFVAQDLTGCTNLYADARAYLGYLVRRVLRRSPGDDPRRALPVRQQRIVGIYCVLLTVGTVVCIGLAVLITAPVAITLIGTSIYHLLTATSLSGSIDGAIVIVIAVTTQVIWTRTWYRKHRHLFVRARHATGSRTSGQSSSTTPAP